MIIFGNAFFFLKQQFFDLSQLTLKDVFVPCYIYPSLYNRQMKTPLKFPNLWFGAKKILTYIGLPNKESLVKQTLTDRKL